MGAIEVCRMYHYHCASFRGSRLLFTETDHPYDLLLLLVYRLMLSGIAHSKLTSLKADVYGHHSVSIQFAFGSTIQAYSRSTARHPPLNSKG